MYKLSPGLYIDTETILKSLYSGMRGSRCSVHAGGGGGLKAFPHTALAEGPLGMRSSCPDCPDVRIIWFGYDR